MFKVWQWLMAMMIFRSYVVGDEGGGAGDDDQIDFVIDDDDPTSVKDNDQNKGGDTPSNVKPATPDRDEGKDEASAPDVMNDKTRKEIDDLKDFKESTERERAIIEANAALTNEYPDFDLQKITDKLKEINKEDPALAEQLNNPTGWENLHLKFFRKQDVEVDPFDAGRGGADEPFDFKEVNKRAMSGDKRAVQKLFDNAK